MIRTVNLISGGGSTNLAIWKAQKPGGILFGLVETVAIICNNSKAAGIARAKKEGFSPKDIHLVSRAQGDLGIQILEILDEYKPDYFHQLGWMPWTPDYVTNNHKGLNQHLGPGGPFMYGERRIFAHLRFCQFVSEMRPIPIFCQLVDPKYDQGDVIYVQFEEFSFTESYKSIADRLLPIEHEVQIEALRLLATGKAKPTPVPQIYKTPEEKLLMDQARIEAHEFYNHKEELERAC